MSQESNLGPVELAFPCNLRVNCEKIEGPKEECLKNDQRRQGEKVGLKRNTQEGGKNARMSVIEIQREFSKRRKQSKVSNVVRSSEIKTNKQKVFFQLAQGSYCKLRREIPMKMWMVVKLKQINEVGMGKKANRNIIA